MNPPVRGSSTSTSQIQVTWTALSTSAETGDSTILSYNLEWDSTGANTTFAEVVGYSSTYTSTSYIIPSVTSGVTYNFRLRAKNKYGWGGYSYIVPIAASSASSSMSAPTVANSGTNVRISWSTPSSNGATITKYKVEIL